MNKIVIILNLSLTHFSEELRRNFSDANKFRQSCMGVMRSIVKEELTFSEAGKRDGFNKEFYKEKMKLPEVYVLRVVFLYISFSNSSVIIIIVTAAFFFILRWTAATGRASDAFGTTFLGFDYIS